VGGVERVAWVASPCCAGSVGISYEEMTLWAKEAESRLDLESWTSLVYTGPKRGRASSSSSAGRPAGRQT
jgi:hypothetical protein